MRIELTTSSPSTDSLSTDLREALWREGSKINDYYTSHTGPVKGTYWTFSRKKMQGKCNERKNFPSYYLRKNKQTNKHKKEKQNKSLVSISNVGDINSGSASFSIASSFRWSSTSALTMIRRPKKVKQSDAITNDHFRLNPNCVTVHRRVNKIKFQMTSFPTC